MVYLLTPYIVLSAITLVTIHIVHNELYLNMYSIIVRQINTNEIYRIIIFKNTVSCSLLVLVYDVAQKTQYWKLSNLHRKLGGGEDAGNLHHHINT